MKNKLKITLIFIFSFILANIAKPYNLKQIANNQDLSNSSITDFCQNEKGLMLIGTCDGLNIYNSRDVQVYQPKTEQNTLSGNILDKILYTGNNTFWIQTYYGLNRFNASTNSVEHYYDFQKLFYIEKDNDNDLFIIRESNSIYYYHKASDTFKKILVSGIIFSNIEQFFIDKNNVIWIITDKGYTLTYKIKKNTVDDTIELIPNKKKTQVCENTLYTFYDNNKIFAIDDNYDLYVYNVFENKKLYITNLKNEIEQRGKISTIIEDKGNFYIGFLTNGLLVIEKDKNTNDYHKKEIGINCGIFKLKKDRLQDIIWIGTDGKGVYIYSNTKYSIRSSVFNSFAHKMERPVRAILMDKNNTLWIGSKGDGIIKIHDYDMDKNIHECKIESLNTDNNELSDNIIYAFAKSNKNILWIGGEEGLNYYSYKTNKIKHYDITIEGENFKYIHDIHETQDSKLWLSSVGMGVICADIAGNDDNPRLENIQHYTINKGDFESNYFFSIYAENDSNIWFGNRGYGPFHFNETTKNLDPIIFYNKYSNQTINDVFSINKDSMNNLLIGTGYGLIKYSSPEKHKLFNTNSGFLNNSIHAIEKGHDNSFWLSTNRGIIEFNSTRDNFRVFGKNSGLTVTEFSDGASYLDKRSNTLFFGGVNGFVSIHKKRNIEQQYMPDIHFERLTIFGEHYNISDKLTQKNNKDQLTLKYKQNFFSISFTAIDYLNGGNFTYYYKIDGLSDQWINNGQSNQASFTNISPGKYNLLVKYYNSNLDKESKIYSLRIRIHPPWYLSIWAYLLYFTLIAVSIGLLLHYFHLKQQQKKQMLLDELDKKHQKDVFESKLRFFTNISHEFCTPLTLISGPCERILVQEKLDKSIVKYVQIIQSNALRLNNLVQELIEFRKIETENREIQIETLNVSMLVDSIYDSFKSVSESRDIEFTKDYKNSIIWNSDKGFLTTIIINLVSNAFKYTKNGKKIHIEIAEQNKNLNIRVSNDGSKINKKDFSHIFDRYTTLDNFENQNSKQSFTRNGLGLAISYNMVKLLHGTIVGSNTDDNQVLFTVELPTIEINKNEPIKTNQQNYIPTIEPTIIKHLPKHELDKSKPTILMVDDDIEMLWFIDDLFSNRFNIISLQDSTQIDKVLEDTSPNVIISDVMMPKLDGFELTKKIKTKKETAHIPIILVSSNFEIQQQIEALSLGAEMYITKPFNTEYLEITVNQIIDRKEKLKDYFSSPLSSFELKEGKYTHKEHKKFMQSVIKIIDDNITNCKLSTEFIANELGMGSRSLYRKIDEIGEQSPASLIKECRLFIAKDLLLKTKLTIEEIVYKSGFSNKVTFFKSFHKRFGCTPKEYRMKSTNNITIETMVNIDNKSF